MSPTRTLLKITREAKRTKKKGSFPSPENFIKRQREANRKRKKKSGFPSPELQLRPLRAVRELGGRLRALDGRLSAIINVVGEAIAAVDRAEDAVDEPVLGEAAGFCEGRERRREG